MVLVSELKANGKTIPLLGEATLINTGSINDLIDTGCYWITSAVSDMPVSNWCVAIVLHCQDSGFQILFTTSGEKMCLRYKGGGNRITSAVSDMPVSNWCVAIVLHCQDSGFQILFTTSGEKMCLRYKGGGNSFSPWRILSIPERDIMVEEGEIAHTYMPAPEDLASS